MKKILLGITGRAGSGKSLFCSFFKDLGWAVIEADRIGWEILKDVRVKKRLREIFGRDIFLEGEIDRKKLGRIVFTDKEKLEILNRIVHPILLNDLKKRIKEESCERVCVDAALIPVWGIGDWFHRVALIKSNMWKEHLKKRGFDPDIIKNLEEIQRGIDEYNGENVVVIENNGTPEQLKEKAKKLSEEMDEIWISHLH